MIPSLFIAVALTATSVGVSVGVWQEAKAIESPNGELLLDVAVMDDISGIAFMVLLFAIIPALKSSAGISFSPDLARTLGLFLLKLIAFGAFCLFILSHVSRGPLSLNVPGLYPIACL